MHLAQVRFVRLLLMEQPQCATCVVSHQLLPPMLEMLLERGGACDNLVNSATLQLLSDIGEAEALSFLRVHLLRRHRSQVRVRVRVRVTVRVRVNPKPKPKPKPNP